MDAVREGSRARRSWECGGFKALRGAGGGGRGLCGGRLWESLGASWALSGPFLVGFLGILEVSCNL